jgi:hypothetical protein
MSTYQRIFDDGITWEGNEGTLVIKIQTNAGSTGHGMRFHFDDSSMELISMPDIQAYGALIAAGDVGSIDKEAEDYIAASDESVDLDGDPSTSSFINFGWVSFGAPWPGSSEAVELVTLHFRKVDGGGTNYGHGYSNSSTPTSIGEAIYEATPPEVGLNITPVDENSGADQVVATIYGGPQGSTYKVNLGDSEDLLEFDASTGEIKLKINPDFEALGNVNFDVSIPGEDDDRYSVAYPKPVEEGETPDLPLVNNIDEIDPVITSQISDAVSSVDENTAAGEVIYTLSATDSADDVHSAVDQITFELDGTDAASFSIEGKELKLNVVPDYEGQTQYLFSVVAVDEAGNRSEAQNLPLVINNLDEVKPVISDGEPAAIDENSGADQVIYTVAATDFGDISATPIKFSLASGSDAALSIDASTGDVKLNANPDHETQSEYNFSVVATDAADNVSEPKSYTLEINDLDDHAPIFADGEDISLSLKETHENKVAEYQADAPVVHAATAADDEVNDVASTPLSYSISEDHRDILSVNSDGEVSFKIAPDFEADSTFDWSTDESGNKYIEFTVTVTDAASNATEQNVKLFIEDVAEFSPVFGDNVASIEENNVLGAIIYEADVTLSPEVVAEFGDGVTYSFTSDTDQSVFSIDSDGVVTINTVVDYENSNNDFYFGVIATDNGGNFKKKEFAVNPALGQEQITLINLDEIAPVISDGEPVAINENTDLNDSGQIIYTVAATDLGDISATPITFSLLAGSDSALSIDELSGQVILTKNPDHETQSEYHFSVVATDAANNVSDPKSYTLKINDLDDTVPLITSEAEADTINENSGLGQVIYTATADDSSDVSDGVTFSLAEGSDSALSIDGSTGEVKLNSNPDHETQSQYSFSVVATDAAGNASEAKSVTLNIEDLDDTAPVITSGDTAVAIDENSGSGQVIYSATADDSADVSDTPISFSLSANSDAALSIDASSGDVTLTADPNYEVQSQYNFSVIATDAAGNESAAQPVSLSINNLDDAAPIIKPTESEFKELASQSDANQIVFAPEGYANPEPLYEAAYDDRNDIQTPISGSQELRFEISFDADNEVYQDRFDIDEGTGVVRYTEVPQTDLEEGELINYTVTAYDGVGLSSSVDLTVKLASRESDAPIFNMPTENEGDTKVLYNEVSVEQIEQNASGVQEFIPSVSAVRGDISESAAEGDVVIYTANTTDVSAVTYSLVEKSHSSLSINPVTGEVSVIDGMNFDAVDSYAFTVEATDSSENPTQQQVVLDVREAYVSVLENSGHNQIIYNTVPNHPNSIFSLEDGHDSALEINAKTGEVFLLANPDFEVKSSYSFTVNVESQGESGSSIASYPVYLSVVNADDEAPVFTNENVDDQLEGSYDVDGILVYTANTNESGVFFELTEESDPGLSIDASSGEVRLNHIPDYEAQSEYSFAVVATDASGNSSDSGTIVLNIVDKDEDAPLFSSASTHNVNEISDAPEANSVDSASNPIIYTAKAIDPLTQKERGPISIEFDQHEDGKVTLRLSIEAEHAAGLENDLQGIQFNLNYSSDVSLDPKAYGAVALDEVNYTSPVVLKVETGLDVQVSQSNSTLGFALSYLDGETAGISGQGLYEVSGSTPIVELTFNVGDEADNLHFSVTNVSFVEGNTDFTTQPSGQTVYEYNLAAAAAADITYSLVEQSSPNITINSETGEVSLVDSNNNPMDPNFEVDSEYSFIVQAEDSAGNTSSQSVKVDINNIDEVSPVFVSDNSVAIDENSGVNQVIYTAAVIDSVDVSEGVEFSLKNGSDPALRIDSRTGEVTLSENPDADTQSSYDFTIIATDKKGNYEEKLVTLDINNLDEKAPVFIDSNGQDIDTPLVEISMMETGTTGKVIYQASTRDNYDVSEGVTYSLTIDSDTSLYIDPVSGKVVLLTSHDYETQSQYNFTIVASDKAENVTKQSVSLTLENYDEHAPVIPLAVEVSVTENVLQGKTFLENVDSQIVHRVVANDSADTSSGLTYDLVGNYDSNLTIDNDGVVRLNEPPNFEGGKGTYTFTVRVSDGVNDPVLQNVTLKVNNVDEQAPEIISSSDAVIVENSGAGNVIYTAAAVDSEDDVTSGLTFSLENSDPGLTIDSQTGEVSLVHNPDFDSYAQSPGKEDYTFTVVATDDEGLSDSKEVTVKVDNVHHVDVVHWSSGVGISGAKVSYDGQVTETDSAGQWDVRTESSAALVVNKDASESDVTAIDVGDALSALRMAAGDQQLGSFAFLSADVDSNGDVNIGDVLNILKYAAGQNVSAIGEWKFDQVDYRDDYEVHKGYLVGDVDGSWGKYSASVSDTNEVTIHVGKLDAGSAVFKYDVRAMDLHSIGEGLSAVKGEISLSGGALPNMAFTLRDKASGELLDHKLLFEAVDVESPTFKDVELVNTIDPDDIEDNVIYSSSANDNDSGNRITYTLENTSTGLTVDKHGDVRLDEGLDSIDEITFTLVAKDEGNRTAEQEVTINLVEADTNAPELDNPGDQTAIDENSLAGETIFTATANEVAVTYSLSRSSDPNVQIDPLSGEVSLVNDANYEHQKDYSFGVIATDSAGNASAIQSVTVNVNNVDEQAPIITSLNKAVPIDENSGSDQVIYTATADDTADISGGVTFSLSADSDAALSIDDASTGEVTLNADRDHEIQSQYSFSVIATDAAGNESAAQAVSLSIIDLDEVAPEVTSGAVADAIDENSGVGQVIYTATADDTADISGGVTFSLSAGSDAALSIDASTGAVTLNADPDYEAQSQYSFSVIATDVAGNPSEAKAVTLDINNVDDTAPVITSGDTAVAIDENSGSGQVIYTAIAGDSLDISGGVTFSLAKGSDAALSIDTDTGAVTLNADPDAETQSQYSFSVIATDVAGNASEANAVTLDINDLDEAAPVLTILDKAEKLVEDTSAQQVIFNLDRTAQDNLDASSAPLTYEFTSNAEVGVLLWNSVQGQVILTEKPDADKIYSFTIKAIDSANNTETAVTHSVSVINVDAEVPVFSSSADPDGVPENSGHNQIVYTAQADGKDMVDGDSVTYSISSSNSDALAINAKTGEVFLLENPDYETLTAYTFSIKAEDSAGYAYTAVTLNVINIDDTAPILEGEEAASIDENSGSGQVIYTADATDDADISGGVTYSLAEGSDAALSIDENTGAVTLSANPDFEAQSSYNFSVVATDAAGNASEAKVVAVGINNVDEIAPVITSSYVADDSVTEIKEDSDYLGGEEVYTITATDLDANDDKDLTYGFLGSHIGFDINPVTGVVFTTSDLNPDFEDQEQHSFVVFASDGVNESVGLPVTVVIVNIDDTAPVITSSSSAVIIEETGANQEVYTAIADDSGDVSDTPITFSLAEGSDAALSIDADTGVVTLSDNPDYEAKTSYDFTVLASDGNGNTGSKSVTLNIANNPLETEVAVPLTGLVSSVFENSGSNQTIYSAGQVSGIIYSLTANSDPAFEIDPVTGSVKLTVNPVFESQDQYNFTVVATNLLNQTAQNDFVLNILAVDGEAPIIISDALALVDVEEEQDIPEGGLIIYIAEVQDSNEQGLNFALASGHHPSLNIDNVGVVRLMDSPDFESQTQFNFTVIVSDAAGNSSEKAVVLQVNNIDEVPPEITSGSVAAAIDENSGSDQVIYTATADDSADTSDGVTFSLAEGSDAALRIDADTGAVTLLANPDAEVQSEYSFLVKATDAAGLSEKQAVSLSINNLDEVAPSITSGAVAAAIGENSGSGQVVYTATADDSADVSGGVTFSLSADSDAALSIDADTGAVTLLTDPDYEAQSEYNFSVVATDAAGNESAAQSVTLDIIPFDNVAPEFLPSPTAIAEGGNLIYQAQANELDVVFSLRSGSDLDLVIDSVSGKVTLKEDAVTDFNVKSMYQFIVEAKDVSGNSSTMPVVVTVENIDTEAPLITSSESIIIAGDIEVGDVVYEASATDSDFNGNEASLTYSLDPSDVDFDIDASTGEVTSLAPITDDASFTLNVNDGTQTVSQSVSIDLAKIVAGNDNNAPSSEALTYEFTQNSNGTFNLQLFVNPTVYSSTIESLDLGIKHTSSVQLSDDGHYGSQVSTPVWEQFNYYQDEGNPDSIYVAQIYLFEPFDPNAGLAIYSADFVLGSNDSDSSFDILYADFDNQAYVDNPYSLGGAGVENIVGTELSDTFLLDGGGSANVVAGAGADIYVITGGVDTDVVIDFVSGQDSIELGSELAAAGYDADSDLLQVAGDTPNLADLIESNSHDLDNTFGAYLDDSTNVLTMFIDSASASDAVNIKQYEVTLAEPLPGDSSFDDDDLSADLSLFIA